MIPESHYAFKHSEASIRSPLMEYPWGLTSFLVLPKTRSHSVNIVMNAKTIIQQQRCSAPPWGRRRYCKLFTLPFGPGGLIGSQILTGIAGNERGSKGSIAASGRTRLPRTYYWPGYH